MPVSLLTVSGRPAVEIEDHAGEIWAYWWEISRRGLSWLVTLECIDPQTGEAAVEERTGRQRTYTVVLTGDSGGWCGCPDYQFRRRKMQQECKHLEHSRELLTVWMAMRGATS